jgi:hypothetical protein
MRQRLALLALPFLLSGCFGGGHAAEAPDDATRVVAPPTTSLPPTPSMEPANTPKYHPHDLWGDRTSVILFESRVRLGDDVEHESYYRDGVLVSGYVEFTPRSDGDDSTSVDKADVVYQGTKALVAKVEWATDPASAQIPGLTFLYKPANSARFTPVENVRNAGEVYVPLSKGMADMPHQMKLSRWRFALEAYDPATAAYPQKAYAARGEAKVTITALNGGEKSIDPPHPYNFLQAGQRPAGEIRKSLDAVVASSEQSGAVQPQGEPLSGWQVDPPTIIPWETTKVHARLYYNYTGNLAPGEAAAAHELRLTYTDASGPEVKTPSPSKTGPGFALYEIPVLPNQGDDPYATHSDWTWGVAPHVAAQDAASDFKGDVHLVLVAEGSDEVSM